MSSSWTAEDRALLLGWRMYQDSLCRCGEPKEIAWHPANSGWYSVDEDEGGATFTCHACTAKAEAEHEGGDAVKPVRYFQVAYTRGADDRPLPETWTDE